MKTKYIFFFALMNIKKGCIRVISTLLLMTLLTSVLISLWIIVDNKILYEEKQIEKTFSEQGLFLNIFNENEANKSVEKMKQNDISYSFDTFAKSYDIVKDSYKVNITMYSYYQFNKELISSVNYNEENHIYISSTLSEVLKEINYKLGDTLVYELLDPKDHDSLYVNHKIVGIYASESMEAYIDVRDLLQQEIISQTKIFVAEPEEISYSEVRYKYETLSNCIDKKCINLSNIFDTYSMQKTLIIVVSIIISLLFIFATFSVITTSIIITSYEKTMTYRILKLHGIKNRSVYMINLIETLIINLIAIIFSTILCFICLKPIMQIGNNILEIQVENVKFSYFIPLAIFSLIIIYAISVSMFYVRKFSSKLKVSIDGGENE